MAASNGMVDPSIFEYLQQRIDEETKTKDFLKETLHDLEKETRTTQSILARAHSTPTKDLPALTEEAESAIQHIRDKPLKLLSERASSSPYYRWNSMWARQMQDLVQVVLLTGYLGGFASSGEGGGAGNVMTIEQVGSVLRIPINLTSSSTAAAQDAFHLSIEEYLHGLISLVEDLARLARNSVTLGDHQRPLQIARSIKDVHAGFQLLNLKNDSLRKRSDAVKYKVKEAEDVVYDLSLRGLVPGEER